jgi:hypothetical protein
MALSLLLLGLTTLFWSLGQRNADEVIGILEKGIALVLLVGTLCVGGMHVLLGFVLLAVAISLPRARVNQAPRPIKGSDEIFLPF